MATVVLLGHPRQRHAAEYARKASAWLAERGHGVIVPGEDAVALGLPELGVGTQELAGTGDLVVALGGDATVLRAVRLVGDRALPVLGVDLGRLGHLAQIEPDELISCLDRFLAGNCSVEERMMLAVSIVRDHAPTGHERGSTVLALNEAVLEKPRPGHAVRLSTSIDGQPWTTYDGDGLIVATPTGSTAYSFSARGPIVSPRMRALLLTPVSPHLAIDRSVVVGDGESVQVEVGDDRPAALTVDGRDRGLLRRGDAIVCRAATEVARFVTFGGRNFYGSLNDRLGVADRRC